MDKFLCDNSEDCEMGSSSFSQDNNSFGSIDSGIVIQSCNSQCKNNSTKKDLNDLPVLVIEYILSHFTYYRVIQLRLISHYWNDVIKEYLYKADRNFSNNLLNYRIQWVAVKEQIEDFNQSTENLYNSSKNKKSRSIPKMSPRYHHSSCYVNDSMYVFGGCMSPSTAYNDLWRFDVNTKKWHRIIAEGTLPLPRLFCSFNLYECRNDISGEIKQFIVLFGGILFDEKLDVKDRLLKTIHFFDISKNRWILIEIQGIIELKSGNHSAVIIGDELIVFNGFRIANHQEVDGNEVYVFDLKTHIWRLQKTKNSSLCPIIRNTSEFSRNQTFTKRKIVQTPFVLDNHNILFIGSCNTHVLLITGFVLKRSYCNYKFCELCKDKSVPEPIDQENEQNESSWEWTRCSCNDVDLAKVGTDPKFEFELTYGGELCKVGNLLAYLTVKNIAVQIDDPKLTSFAALTDRQHPAPLLFRGHGTLANKQLLRERRIETLDYYKRHIQNIQDRMRASGGSSSSSIVHKYTLQLRLLDTSKVISENRIIRRSTQHFHEIDYTVSPGAISCYSLVATPDSLLLFGGYLIDQRKEVEVVSNKLYMLVSKPQIKLY